jgi:hypothetical protein
MLPIRCIPAEGGAALLFPDLVRVRFPPKALVFQFPGTIGALRLDCDCISLTLTSAAFDTMPAFARLDLFSPRGVLVLSASNRAQPAPVNGARAIAAQATPAPIAPRAESNDSTFRRDILENATADSRSVMMLAQLAEQVRLRDPLLISPAAIKPAVFASPLGAHGAKSGCT